MLRYKTAYLFCVMENFSIKYTSLGCTIKPRNKPCLLYIYSEKSKQISKLLNS